MHVLALPRALVWRQDIEGHTMVAHLGKLLQRLLKEQHR